MHLPRTMHLPRAKPFMSRKVMKVKGSREAKATNAGRRAQALNKSVKSARASNAPHSQGNFSDPPVRLQHPRLRTEEPRFGFHEGSFHCGAIGKLLCKGRPLRLVAMSLKESTVPGAGRGLFVREDVWAKTIFSEYGGELITLDEARKWQMEVTLFLLFLRM